MYMTLAAVLTSVLLLWTSMTALIEAFREKGVALLRAREEVMEQALARAKGLEQVGSKVAHELKNPLAAVKGLVQLMGRNCPNADGKSKERLSVIEREVARMETILTEYLSFSRPLEDLNAQEIEVDAVVGDVLAVLEARAQVAQVTLSSEGQARAFADPRRLKEALLNLVANALESTPPGGSVDVRVEGVAGGGARLFVKDTGRGMSQEVLERVGTPFFTTRERGTGLGVTLARAVFTQHGGELRYESKPGTGTTATALLPPRAQPCAAYAASGKIDGQAPAGR
jgi:signal transduction histidine kinase